MYGLPLSALSSVAPPVGAWIEIDYGYYSPDPDNPSLPPWERGLKFRNQKPEHAVKSVAPPVGAWIEICFARFFCSVMYVVAPPVGAWIEISQQSSFRFAIESLPPWERGLKLMVV